MDGYTYITGESMRKYVIASFCIAISFAGCASLTPTQEERESYAIYDIHPVGALSDAQLADAIKTGLQKQTGRVQVTQSIPPSPLPEKPGRFKLVNPFGRNSNLGALSAMAGQSLQIPVCEDAILTARAGNDMGKYREKTTFFMCVLPYQGGYHLDVYTKFAMASGGFSPEVLGATLARKVVGDSSQSIPRTIASVVQSIKSTGASVTLLQSYP